MSEAPSELEALILWLDEQKLRIHNFWRTPVGYDKDHKWYCVLSTERIHASNKVFAGGCANTPLEAVQAAYENYLNPPKTPITKLSKKEIALSLADLGL